MWTFLLKFNSKQNLSFNKLDLNLKFKKNYLSNNDVGRLT